MKVSFVGAGAMGLGMLANIAKRFDVRVFDISAAARDRAVAHGAVAAETLDEAVASCDVFITMLPTAAAVREVYASDAFRQAKGKTCIDMSTIDPGLAVRIASDLANFGVDFLDSPVSGGGPKAMEGVLTLMVGGSGAVLDRVRPILETMATSIVHVGPVGTGSAAKLANNVIAASSMVATAEAFQIAEAFGVDRDVLTRILETSSGNTWVLHNMHPAPNVRPGSPSSNGYAPGFTTTLMLEMLDLIRTAGAEKNIPLTIVPAVSGLWQLAANHGYGARDCTSVFEFIQPPVR